MQDSPTHYVRAFKIIQADLERLFQFVEPSQECLTTYSYRIHELLMRTCIEVEANFKAILSENIYTPAIDRFGNPVLNMTVYRKIDITHHLSSYEISLPIWNGSPWIIKPFEEWKSGQSLQWYRAYNVSKHNRQDEFKNANIKNLILAVSGLLVVLSSQFYTEEFSAGPDSLGAEGYDYYDMDAAIGSFFRITFPDDWSYDQIYDFDWNKLKKEADRFEKIDYDNI